jgi:hypothetical protein
VRCCPIQQRERSSNDDHGASSNPLWTLGIAAAITGALALVLCAFAGDSLFMPDLSRRKILIWGLVLVTGSAPCLAQREASRAQRFKSIFNCLSSTMV